MKTSIIVSNAMALGTVMSLNSYADAQNNLTLVKQGSSKYVIALANDAIPAEHTAAKELQSYLKQITGATLPIRSEGAVKESAPQILVGNGKRARRLLPQSKWNSIGNDGILIQTKNEILVLAGSRPRGALYAVYEFLEKSAGVRWWTPTESTIPKKLNLVISSQNIAYTPPFAYREHLTSSVQQDARFATISRQNGQFQTQKEALGGHYTIIGFVHTFDNLMPFDKYFATHPEWYSDPSNGGKPCTTSSPRPEPQTSQLNLTNQAMRKELVKNALAWVRANPKAGLISISQNDNMNYCRSEGDMALIEREGSPSGPLIDLVNEVAEAVEKEFPGFLVETLAYQYTRKPPRTIKPRKNVIIRLCSIEADFARPLDSTANQSFQNDMNGWKAISNHIYIWDYITNFTRSIWVHPNLRVLGPNLRYFQKNKVYGIFEQGDAYSNGVGDFVQLRTWLVAHLMWNPQQNDDTLINEFLKGYYGPAAPYLKNYLNIFQDSFLKTGKPLDTFHSDHSYLNVEVVNSAWEELQKARKAVANQPILAKRVRRESLVLDNIIIEYRKRLKNEVTETGKTVSFLPKDMPAFIADFIKTAKKNGAQRYSESKTFESHVDMLNNIRLAAPLPAPFNEMSPERMKTDVIDGNDCEIVFWPDMPGLKNVEDPLATAGRAVRLAGQSNEWLLQYNITAPIEKLTSKPWRAYARIRFETKQGADPEKLAFSAGIYDVSKKMERLTTPINGTGLFDGQYHLVDLGTVNLDSGCYFWIAPPNREDVVAVYVDRVLLVRQS